MKKLLAVPVLVITLSFQSYDQQAYDIAPILGMAAFAAPVAMHALGAAAAGGTGAATAGTAGGSVGGTAPGLGELALAVPGIDNDGLGSARLGLTMAPEMGALLAPSLNAATGIATPAVGTLSGLGLGAGVNALLTPELIAAAGGALSLGSTVGHVRLPGGGRTTVKSLSGTGPYAARTRATDPRASRFRLIY